MATTRSNPAVSQANTVAGEHDIQLQLLDAIEHAVSDGHAQQDIMALLDQLIDYTEAHFHSEELIMRLFAFPQYEAHRSEHASLVQKTASIREQFKNGDTSTATDGINALRDWLKRHMDSKDLGLMNFLKRTPPQPPIAEAKQSGTN